MRVPMSWLREMVDLPIGVTGREVADRLTSVGLEVESVTLVGGGVSGPVVVGRVESIEELTEFKKPIRLCRVESATSSAERATSPRGISSWSHSPVLSSPVTSPSPRVRRTAMSPTG